MITASTGTVTIGAGNLNTTRPPIPKAALPKLTERISPILLVTEYTGLGSVGSPINSMLETLPKSLPLDQDPIASLIKIVARKPLR